MDKDEWYKAFSRAAAACGKTPAQIFDAWGAIEPYCEMQRKNGESPYAVAAELWATRQ